MSAYSPAQVGPSFAPTFGAASGTAGSGPGGFSAFPGISISGVYGTTLSQALQAGGISQGTGLAQFTSQGLPSFSNVFTESRN